MEYLFWIAVCAILFAYIGYPVSLYIISLIRTRSVNRSYSYQPSVSIIIAGYNVEDIIEKKLVNTLQLDYPLLEIIVSSDGSTDSTVEKANCFKDRYSNYDKIVVLDNERKGKENAQKEAARVAEGEILIFTDCSISLETDSIHHIVSNFNDTSIGGISAEPTVIGKGGEGIYQKYDVKIREMESSINTLVGLSGAFFACRSNVCVLTNGLDSDFKTALDAVKDGYRTILDNRIKATYSDSGSSTQEFQRKVRTLIRGMNVFFTHNEMLNVWEYGLFSYQYFCHKLLKWSVPLVMSIAFLSNAVIAWGGSNFYALLMVGQILFYTVALIGTQYKNKLTRIPTFFVISNVAIAIAWYKYLTGERMVCWRPTKRI